MQKMDAALQFCRNSAISHRGKGNRVDLIVNDLAYTMAGMRAYYSTQSIHQFIFGDKDISAIFNTSKGLRGYSLSMSEPEKMPQKMNGSSVKNILDRYARAMISVGNFTHGEREIDVTGMLNGSGYSLQAWGRTSKANLRF